MSRALYKQLTDDFLEKIGTGEIKVGERLPPEDHYAEQLGVSRSTLRLAFNQLELSGIIKRKKRGGTQVISDKPVERYNMVSGGIYDILSLGRDSLLSVSDVRFVKTEEVDDLASYQGISSRWLCIAGSRLIADQKTPYTCTQVYVPDRYSELTVKPGDRIPSVFRKIEEQYGVCVGRVKQSVSCIPCPEASAELMGMKEGEPVMTILAELMDGDAHLLEVGFSYFDPSRLNISSDVQIAR